MFSQSEALEGDGTETHYTYYPATISDAGAGTMVTGVQASDTILSQGAPAGNVKMRQFFCGFCCYACLYSTVIIYACERFIE